MAKDMIHRIQQRLAALGLSESSAAKKSGLSADGIRNIRRDLAAGKPRSVTFRTAERLAETLQTNPQWLLTGEGDESAVSFPSVTMVPMASWVSAGAAQAADIVTREDDVPSIPVADLPTGDWIALKVEGDSMDLIAPPGATILVNLKRKQLVNRAYYVFLTQSGETTFKQYRNDPLRLQPASTNRAHEPLYVADEIKVVGRVSRIITDV